MTATIRTLPVRTPSRAYDAVVGPGLIGQLGQQVRSTCAGTRRAFLFVDAGLPHALVSAAENALRSAGFECPSLRVEVSEKRKSLDTLATLLGALTEARLERTEPVIALGGGILGDTAGFAAASYRRGVPWINCPTTLLSMVDASVGGKTAVNIDTGGSLKKNMVGAFHQPSLVLADTDALATLPPRAFRAGLAECVKHGLIAADWGDPGLFDWTESNAQAILACAPPTLTELISRNIAIKAAVVASDEREQAPDSDGGRTLLNLGHTFAHAIEPIPTLSPDDNPANAPLQHGEAVSLGLIAACATAAHPAVRLAEPALVNRLRALLGRFRLPVAVAGLPTDEQLLVAMAHDKKVAGGRLRLVLPTTGGRARVLANVAPEAVRAGWTAIRIAP